LKSYPQRNCCPVTQSSTVPQRLYGPRDINSRFPDGSLMACTEEMISPPRMLCSIATDPNQLLSMGDIPIAVERPLRKFAMPHLFVASGIHGWSRHSENVNDEAALVLWKSSGRCLECFDCRTIVVCLSLTLTPEVNRLLGRAGSSACKIRSIT